MTTNPLGLNGSKPVDSNAANKKAEADYLKNLQTPGFTGTFGSSDSKAMERVRAAESKYRPSAEQQAASQSASQAQDLNALGLKQQAENEAGIAGFDSDYLDGVAKQLGMSSAATVGFLRRMGISPTKIQVPSVPTVSPTPGDGTAYTAAYKRYRAEYQADVDSGEISASQADTRALAAANKEFNPKLPPVQAVPTGDSGLYGAEHANSFAGNDAAAKLYVQNLLSNTFGPGGRNASSAVGGGEFGIGTGQSGTGNNVGFLRSDQPAPGMAGLQTAAPNQMLASFMEMPIFSNANTQERQSMLEQLGPLFAMLTDATSTEGTPGPQTVAYRFRGGY